MESGNIKDTFGKFKDKVNNSKTMTSIKNSKIAKRFAQDGPKVRKWVVDNWWKILIVSLIVTSIWFYMYHFYSRVPRYLKKMKAYDKIINPKELASSREIANGDYKLCDFFIASSYKSYLPCTNYYDYSSCEAIEKVLIYGARYIDLDIFNKDFNQCTEPVVCEGTEIGNWHWTTELKFESVCKTISQTAFGPKVSAPNDPLFINLNLYVNENYDTINQIAALITKYFSHKLLPERFSRQGINPDPEKSVNICTTHINELLGKIIIICDSGFQNTDLDELVNISSSTIGNLRNLKYSHVKETYDADELKTYNNKSLTRVLPDKIVREKTNFNWATPWYLGCQFICMDYFSDDDYMKSYLKRFSKCSFILKPYKLRYHPTLIAPPKAQIPHVSFAPEQLTTPTYSITY